MARTISERLKQGKAPIIPQIEKGAIEQAPAPPVAVKPASPEEEVSPESKVMEDLQIEVSELMKKAFVPEVSEPPVGAEPAVPPATAGIPPTPPVSVVPREKPFIPPSVKQPLSIRERLLGR